MKVSSAFVYLDTSAALAHLLSETVRPPASIWDEALISSRLLEYEIHTRLQALSLEGSHASLADELLGRVSLLDTSQAVLRRPLPRWPVALRTLDTLHLASMGFLRQQGVEPRLASYDRRLNAAALEVGFELYRL